MYKITTILLLLIAIISCENDDNLDYTVGDDFIQSETSIAIIDTFKVNLSSFMADSVATSNTSVALIGSYQDPELGLVQARSYFQLGTGDVSFSSDDDDQLDSLTLKMRYSDYIYGDTTKIRTINVYRLTQDLELPKNQDYFYNNTSLSHEADPIGSITFAPRPMKDNDMEIRLNDTWGEKLLNMIKDGNDTIGSTSEFIKYLPGLYVESETTDGSVLGFTLADTTCYMVIYASRFDMEKVETEFKFTFTNSEVQFNNIQSDRSGTNSALITNNNILDISSSLSGNRSFIQAGTGIFTRIEFPGLSELLQMDQQRILLKAELILKPIYQSYLDYDLPETLYLYESNRVNEIGDVVTNSSDESVTAKVVIDEFYHKDTYYQFDITEFISTELADGYFDVEHALLTQISNSDIKETVDRIVFADNTQSQFKPLLKIYYVFYN